MSEGSAINFSPTIVQSSLIALAGLSIVCFASRMSVSESSIGAHGKKQILHTVNKIAMESQTQADMSRQDTDPLIALLHNIEAASGFKAAKRLSEECGVANKESSDQYLSDLCDLTEEQDSILRSLLDRIEL